MPDYSKFEAGGKMISYGFKKQVSLSFTQTVEAVTQELKKEGFGILTSIDVREKFREKLGMDFPYYLILGACNPDLAHRAILEEEDIGLLLPCNVVIYDKDGGTVLDVIKPSTAMGMVDNPGLKETAKEVEAKLKKVFDAVK
jgi:uncharacterized protein (DUF302 family)